MLGHSFEHLLITIATKNELKQVLRLRLTPHFTYVHIALRLEISERDFPMYSILFPVILVFRGRRLRRQI